MFYGIISYIYHFNFKIRLFLKKEKTIFFTWDEFKYLKIKQYIMSIIIKSESIDNLIKFNSDLIPKQLPEKPIIDFLTSKFPDYFGTIENTRLYIHKTNFEKVLEEQHKALFYILKPLDKDGVLLLQDKILEELASYYTPIHVSYTGLKSLFPSRLAPRTIIIAYNNSNFQFLFAPARGNMPEYSLPKSVSNLNHSGSMFAGGKKNGINNPYEYVPKGKGPEIRK